MRFAKSHLRLHRMPVIVALTCLLLGGCANSPKTEYYTLTAEQTAEELCATGGGEVLIKIALSGFPELLAQPQIATRPQPNRIEYAEFHRWAGSLESAFQQSLAENLHQSCRRVQVIPDFWPDSSAPFYQLNLEVVRFDGDLGGNVNLTVKWTLLGKQQKTDYAMQLDKFVEPVAGNNYVSLVAAQGHTVAKLAEKILQTLLRSE